MQKNFVANLAIWFAVGIAFVSTSKKTANAQGIVVASPFNTIGDSYYENFGVNFGFHLNNGAPGGSRIVGIFPNGQINPNGIVFNQAGSAGAIPPFGGYDPAANANFGFGLRNRRGGFSLGLSLGKGNTRTATNQTPMVVVPNGGIGSVTNGQFSPFVTSVTPFTFGNGYSLPSTPSVRPSIFRSGDRTGGGGPSFNGMSYGAIRSAMARLPDETRKIDRSDANIVPENSTAQTADVSVERIKAERRQQMQAENDTRQSEIRRLVERAEYLLKEGDVVLARTQYYKASRIAKGAQQKELRSKYESLRNRKR